MEQKPLGCWPSDCHHSTNVDETLILRLEEFKKDTEHLYFAGGYKTYFYVWSKPEFNSKTQTRYSSRISFLYLIQNQVLTDVHLV
jgi:hypothetical protein